MFGTRHLRYLGPYIAVLIAIGIVAGALVLATHAGKRAADRVSHSVQRQPTAPKR